MGNHVKSPVELLAGIRRQLPMDIGNEDIQLLIQRALGQILFYPPNVAGWPGGKSWIDSSSLLLRMRLPQMLSTGDGIEINVKSDDDTEMGMSRRAAGALNRFSLNATIDWNEVLKPFEKIAPAKQFEMMASCFLQTKKLPERDLINYLSNESPDARKAIIALMSLPEYQLC
jgi:hypothetical protein